MKSKKPRRRTIAWTHITGIGTLKLIHAGTQFHMKINDARLESVRTPGAAKKMFDDATKAMRKKKVA